ncbi:unnamed protein product [Leuciscus chuanchicus]
MGELEAWQGLMKNILLPRCANEPQQQSQKQLDNEGRGLMTHDPSEGYNHTELTKTQLEHALLKELEQSLLFEKTKADKLQRELEDSRSCRALSIEWPGDRQGARSKSKLDERFLPSRAQPQCRSLPFFPDLHTEVSRSWEKPVSYRVYTAQTSHYSSIHNYKEHGYGEMPKVEETLASYLSPATASSLKAPALPSKPVKVTSSLVHKAYAAGQAAACLHTMSIMQAYQAELLGDSEDGGGISADTVSELRRATDLSLRATKETAKSIFMAALVATERHLWLNLSDIKDKEKHVLLDAPVSTQGLFGDAVNSAVAKSQEASKQAAALQKLLPRRSFYEAAEREPPHSSKKSAEHRATQKQSVSSRAPPQKSRGHGGRSQTQHSSRGDRSANPAASGVTGRSGLRRAHISRSTRKRSGLGMPAPSEEGARAVWLVVPCRCAVTGRRTDYSTAGEKYGAVSFGALRGLFCQPCRLWCYRAQRSPASTYLKVHPET